MNTPHPEPLAALAGTRKVLETAHKLIGATWGDEGTTREQRAPTADPDIIRRLDNCFPFRRLVQLSIDRDFGHLKLD